MFIVKFDIYYSINYIEKWNERFSLREFALDILKKKLYINLRQEKIIVIIIMCVYIDIYIYKVRIGVFDR